MNPLKWLDGIVSKNLETIAEQARAFVLLVAILVGLAVAVALAVDDQAVRIVVLCLAFVVALAISYLLYRITRASARGGEGVDHAALGKALALVNGLWWQLVVHDARPGLTVVNVDLSVLPDRHRLSGTKYAPDGKEMASWKSRAVGLMEVDPVEVFYYWRGGNAGEAGSVSGVGFFDFPSDDAPSDAGTGWFTTGDVEKGDFSESSKVHLRRISGEDKATLAAGGEGAQSLIRQRYREWAGAYATT